MANGRASRPKAARPPRFACLVSSSLCMQRPVWKENDRAAGATYFGAATLRLRLWAATLGRRLSAATLGSRLWGYDFGPRLWGYDFWARDSWGYVPPGDVLSAVRASRSACLCSACFCLQRVLLQRRASERRIRPALQRYERMLDIFLLCLLEPPGSHARRRKGKAKKATRAGGIPRRVTSLQIFRMPSRRRNADGPTP